jgi:hypothetical protein
MACLLIKFKHNVNIYYSDIMTFLEDLYYPVADATSLPVSILDVVAESGQVALNLSGVSISDLKS